MHKLIISIILCLFMPLSATSADGWFSMVVGNTKGGGSSTPAPFVTVWRTTTPNESIVFPAIIGYTYNAVIDWGDGTQSTITAYNDPDKTHVYANPGDYIVSVSGKYSYFYDTVGPTNKQKLIAVNNLGEVEWEQMGFAFGGYPNLVSFTAGVNDISLVTSLEETFTSSPIVNLDLSTLDTSNIESFIRTFYQGPPPSSIPIGDLNISSLIGSIDLTGDLLTTAFYSDLLIGWAAQAPNIQSGVEIRESGEPEPEISGDAVTAKALLVNTYGWIIQFGRGTF